MPKRPNIVIFNPDQWRGDMLGHTGGPAGISPNLDRAVAEDHVSFRWAFCQNPVCTPSRCSFMTGWYPHVRGHRTMHHMLRVHEGEPVLLKTLKDAGYHVWWGGKNDLVPRQHGFDHVCDVKYAPTEPVDPIWESVDGRDLRGEPGSDTYYSFYRGRLLPSEGRDHYHDADWANVEGAIEFIRNYDRDEPFCIFLPLTYPHPPYAVEDPWYGLVDRDAMAARIPTPESGAGKPAILSHIRERLGMDGWTEDRWRELRAVYAGMCARVDHQYGLLLDALREAGQYDETACFLFADHGDFTGDYGLVEKTQNTFEDCLTRVPFLVKPPRNVPVRPRVSDALVELVDFPATVEALTGVAPAHDHFGRSLLPVLAGETDEHRDAVFCEGGRRHGETQCMEKEYTPDLDPATMYWPRMTAQRTEGPQHSKATMCRTRDWKYVRRLYEADELYDLRSDPGETTNRIDDPACAEILAGLRDRMLAFYHETSDVVPREADRR